MTTEEIIALAMKMKCVPGVDCGRSVDVYLIKAHSHTDSAMHHCGAFLPLSDRSVGAGIGNDFTNGNRGMAKAKTWCQKIGNYIDDSL
jgi:hypothetical protein